MEDGLVLSNVNGTPEVSFVLILVVVEDGLVPDFSRSQWRHPSRLNPCCSGRWSRTILKIKIMATLTVVLILVVVEDGLVRTAAGLSELTDEGLNPCCSGRWSRT